MTRISEHISDLLYHHDCVILPDFGGFIANYHPAQIDAQRKLIHPPSKIILFNKYVKVNDGLLASKIVREERVSYEKANKRITKFVKQTRKKINAGERVEIGKVGVLYLDAEANIQFIQDENNFLTSSFGLPAVDLIPVQTRIAMLPPAPVKEKLSPKTTSKNQEKETIKPTKVIRFNPEIRQPEKPAAKQVEPAKEQKTEQVSPTVQPKVAAPLAKTTVPKTLPKQEEKKEDKKKRGGLVWAAAILIPLFILYGAGVAYFGLNDQPSFNTASFNPISWFNRESESIEQPNSLPIQEEILPTDTVEEIKLPVADTLEINQMDTAEAIVEATPESTYVEPPVVENVVSFRYQVVGGCFSKDKYADKFIEEMISAGFDARQIDVHKGLRRISLGGTNSRKEARAIRKQAEDQGISCWILRL